MSLDSFPVEIVAKFLDFLDQRTFIRCSMISKYFSVIVFGTQRVLKISPSSKKILATFRSAKFWINYRLKLTKTMEKIVSDHPERILKFTSCSAKYITDNIPRMINLKEFYFLGSDLPSYVTKIPSLKILHCPLTAANTLELKLMTGLEELKVKLNLPKTEFVSSVPNLKKLKLIIDDKASHWAPDDTLNKIKLEKLSVTLPRGSNSKIVECYKSSHSIKISDNFFRGTCFSQFENLTSLQLCRCSMFGAHNLNFLKNLRKLRLCSMNVGDHHIKNLTSLESLTLENDMKITKSPSKLLRVLILKGKIKFQCNTELDLPFLKTFAVEYNKSVTNVNFELLSDLTSLRLQSCSVKGDKLKFLTNLRSLGISYSKCITAEHIAQFKRMDFLYLWGNEATAKSCAYF